MKKSFFIIGLIIIISGYTNAVADLSYGGTGTYENIQDSLPANLNTDYNVEKSPASPQIDYKIFYGLNESHSRSWVRENSDGVVGIVYFQRFEGSLDQGTLIYKTIQLDGSANSDSVTVGNRLEKAVLLYDSLTSHCRISMNHNR